MTERFTTMLTRVVPGWESLKSLELIGELLEVIERLEAEVKSLRRDDE